MLGSPGSAEGAPTGAGAGVGAAADAAPESVDVEAGAAATGATLRATLAAKEAELQLVREWWQQDKQRHAEELKAEEEKRREVREDFCKGFQAVLDEKVLLEGKIKTLQQQLKEQKQLQVQLDQAKMREQELHNSNEELRRQVLVTQMDLAASQLKVARLQGQE